jgi:histidyl-tRNA synthetase
MFPGLPNPAAETSNNNERRDVRSACLGRGRQRLPRRLARIPSARQDAATPRVGASRIAGRHRRPPSPRRNEYSHHEDCPIPERNPRARACFCLCCHCGAPTLDRTILVTPLQPARGTKDLIGEDLRRHRQVIETARRIAETFGFEEWATPIFEDSRVFSRTLGETSDVVTKEMYSFTDRSGESLTLRPEATAGVCRALVSNGLTQSLPQRVFCAGPMFRYERPQKGRYRQFHQIDIELIGPAHPLADAEVIACGFAILEALGIAADITLEINTLGDAESRSAYRAALVAYFTTHRDALSAESQARLERNPLRILDSKERADRPIIAGAPVIAPYLTAEAAAFYAGVKQGLTDFGVPFRDNPRIVRGLDYYGHTAFEFVTTELGAQGTVMAGGRYDGLVTEMGGPPTPSVGWAAGIERLAMLLPAAPAATAPVAVVPVSPALEAAAIGLLRHLRQAGIRAEMEFAGNLRRRMERANRIGARAAVILGEEEAARDTVQLKDLASGAQNEVPLAELLDRLA